MKPALLFLCHRIPYPPNKGDKIRSYHLLRYLAEHYRVYLGAFIDDKPDWEYVERVREWCEQTCFVDLNPARARISCLRGLFQGLPLTLPYYSNNIMRTWVVATVREQDVGRVLIYSSAMAQYVLAPEFAGIRRVVDFVDVDSDKWRQYAGCKPWPLNWVYRREAGRLFNFERKVASGFDAGLFVSAAEAQLFRQLAPRSAGRIRHYNNGVDSKYFSPDNQYPDPFRIGEQALVFTGAMDYWPNVDAVSWFAQEVFPRVLEQHPNARFYIVGGRPAEAVQRLAGLQGVVVTGTVPDVRPYLRYALAAVAPMRIARGVQNKVLEAMAMSRPVIVTGMGLEGIQAASGEEVLVADTPDEFLRQIEFVLAHESGPIGPAARDRVCRDFSWEENLPIVRELLEKEVTA